jgi:putative transposase
MIYYNILMYIVALINNRGKCNCSALAEVVGISHDVFTTLLHKNWEGEILLWYCIQRIHPLTKGYLIIDDTWIEKCFSWILKCVSKQWSGKYKTSLLGMTVVMVLWTDGKYKIPLYIRIWHKGGKKNRN